MQVSVIVLYVLCDVKENKSIHDTAAVQTRLAEIKASLFRVSEPLPVNDNFCVQSWNFHTFPKVQNCPSQGTSIRE